MIYRSKRSVYDWSGPRIKNLETNVRYHARYVDPGTGRVFVQKDIMRIQDGPEPDFEPSTPVFEEKMLSGSQAYWKEFGEDFSLEGVAPGVATARESISACSHVFICQLLDEKDVCVCVSVKRHMEAGIVLRFQDMDNYLVAVYSPAMEAIYFLQRIHGAWGPFFQYRIPYLGIADAPNIQAPFRLSAIAHGNFAAMKIDDGIHHFCSPCVPLQKETAGCAGVLSAGEAGLEQYSDFRASIAKCPLELPKTDTDCYVVRTGEDVAPPVPSPQDWILVLQRA